MPRGTDIIPRWVSREKVASWAGCTHKTVDRAVRLGLIVQRTGERTRGMPSLDRASAEAWATAWATEQQARRGRRALRRSGPPDDGDVWLNTATAAIITGLTVPWMRRLAEAQRAPATKVGQRWWWRRDHVEIYAAARVVPRTRLEIRLDDQSEEQRLRVQHPPGRSIAPDPDEWASAPPLRP